MDGDVARKEKEIHCLCETTICELKNKQSSLECTKIKSGECPVELPCTSHAASVEGYMEHLTYLITSWLNQKNGVCIAIPCDSIDTWVVAAYDKFTDIEQIGGIYEFFHEVEEGAGISG